MRTDRIAVVGGGIIGCLVAREAARSGAGVTLVDRDLVGLGASGRSAGVHFPLGRTERVRAMSAYSQAYYDALKDAFPALPIQPLALDAAVPVGAAREHHARFLHPGRPGAMVAAEGRRVPWPDGGTTWRLPGCQVADVGDLVGALVRDLRDRAAVLEGVRVLAVDEHSSGVTLTLGTGESREFDQVVLCPGPWANADEWRRYTAGLGIRIKKVVALHVDQPVDADDVGVFFPVEDAFLVPVRHRGHWLFSYTCPDWDVLPDSLHDGLSAADLARARAVLVRYAPALADRVRGGRVFCDAYSPAREPLVVPVGATGRVVFAGAANGSGYRLGPAIATAAVQLLAIHHPSEEMPSCAS
jgi:glycine/D-amino acid oxidase-like deaminating enzyme